MNYKVMSLTELIQGNKTLCLSAKRGLDKCFMCK